MNHRDITNSATVKCSLGGFGTDPEGDLPIKPLNDAFLKLTQHTDRPGIKSTPNWTKDFVHISDAIGAAPPRGKPGNPMMLVDNQVKRLLPAIPTDRFGDGGPLPATA